jgi:hypothetical protein
VTEDIRFNLVMLDFTQAFNMSAHDLMGLRGSQRYSDEAMALFGSYLSDRTHSV